MSNTNKNTIWQVKFVTLGGSLCAANAEVNRPFHDEAPAIEMAKHLLKSGVVHSVEVLKIECVFYGTNQPS